VPPALRAFSFGAPVARSMTIAWALPTKRSDGTALPANEVKESEVALSADNGATWSVLGTVPNNTTQTFNKDLAPGAYKARVVVIDTLGQRGVPAISDAVVLPAPPAAPVVTVTVA
jgi:predicted phage tail protein